MIGPIVYCEHKEFDILSLDGGFVEVFVDFANPKALLHNEVLMDFVPDDLITGLFVFVLLMKCQKFEPVDKFIIAAGDVLLPDYERPLDKDFLHFFGDHVLFINMVSLITIQALNNDHFKSIGAYYSQQYLLVLNHYDLRIYIFIISNIKETQKMAS